MGQIHGPNAEHIYQKRPTGVSEPLAKTRLGQSEGASLHMPSAPVLRAKEAALCFRPEETFETIKNGLKSRRPPRRPQGKASFIPFGSAPVNLHHRQPSLCGGVTLRRMPLSPGGQCRGHGDRDKGVRGGTLAELYWMSSASFW